MENKTSIKIGLSAKEGITVFNALGKAAKKADELLKRERLEYNRKIVARNELCPWEYSKTCEMGEECPCLKRTEAIIAWEDLKKSVINAFNSDINNFCSLVERLLKKLCH